MALGLASAQANSLLNIYRNTASPAIATVFVALHTGDPGSAGTAAASGLTTRNQITWNAASGGSMTMNTLSSFTMNTTETLTHVSLWTASSAGTFLQSAVLVTPVNVVNGAIVTFTAFTLSFALAA